MDEASFKQLSSLIEQLNNGLTSAGKKNKIALVRLDQLDLLEKNAHFMKNETFSQLKNNIEHDGDISQLPYCHKNDERFTVLSGNHRVMASREAGLDTILVLYTDEDLSKEEQISISLSHNSIFGEDDPAILRELWSEIQSIDLKKYSGLDEEAVKMLQSVDISSLSPAQLNYSSCVFLFLPGMLDTLNGVIEQAIKTIGADQAFLARFEDYDGWMDALANVKAAYNVKNTAAALSVILEVFQKHQGDLKAGWLDEGEESVLHKGWIPLCSILGTDQVPAEAAITIQKAVARLIDRSEITSKNKWQALEYWAADYLSGA